MRRLISVLITTTLIFSTVMTAFAGNLNKTTDFIDTQILTTQSLIAQLSESGGSVEITEQDENRTAFVVTYGDELPGIESHFIVEPDKNGNLELIVTEGEKQDHIMFLHNGKVYLDGNLVTMYVDSLSFNSEQGSLDSIVQPSAQRMYYTETCPWGSSTEYRASWDSSKSNINFGKVIIDMTIGGLTSLMIGLLVHGNVPAAILSGLAAGLISYCSLNDPFSTAASYTESGYVHYLTGFTISPSMAVIKRVYVLYAYTNYQNEFDRVTYYQVFAY